MSTPDLPPCIRPNLALSSLMPDQERAGYIPPLEPTECAYALGGVVCGHAAERDLLGGITRLNDRQCLKMASLYAEDSQRLTDRLWQVDPDGPDDV